MAVSKALARVSASSAWAVRARWKAMSAANCSRFLVTVPGSGASPSTGAGPRAARSWRELARSCSACCFRAVASSRILCTCSRYLTTRSRPRSGPRRYCSAPSRTRFHSAVTTLKGRDVRGVCAAPSAASAVSVSARKSGINRARKGLCSGRRRSEMPINLYQRAVMPGVDACWRPAGRSGANARRPVIPT